MARDIQHYGFRATLLGRLSQRIDVARHGTRFVRIGDSQALSAVSPPRVEWRLAANLLSLANYVRSGRS